LEFKFRPEPNQPGQTQIGVALGGGKTALSVRGILVNVAIGVDETTADALRALGQPVPNPVSHPALIDTGASMLSIDSSIAQALNLTRRGIVNSHTANGPRQCNLYAVSLAFPATALRSYNIMRASEVDLSTQQFKVLIGRDVLANWHIHYNGQTGAVSIAD
jgi:predicted aspartyl protease